MSKSDHLEPSSSSSALTSLPLAAIVSNSGESSGSGSDVLELMEHWKLFDFYGAKGKMEKQCIEMREMKTCSINGRKRLNDITRAFRSDSKINNNAVTVVDMLKAYQGEIDQLSKRSKFSESAYFALFKSLDELPGQHTCIIR